MFIVRFDTSTGRFTNSSRTCGHVASAITEHSTSEEAMRVARAGHPRARSVTVSEMVDGRFVPGPPMYFRRFK